MYTVVLLGLILLVQSFFLKVNSIAKEGYFA